MPSHPTLPSSLFRPTAAWRACVLAGAALLLSPAFATAPASSADAARAAKPPSEAVAKIDKADKSSVDKKAGKKESAKKEAVPQKPGPLADFGSVTAPADVTHVANWVSYTHNNKKKAFVLIDKKMARMYVFDPQGKLKSDSPVLLGKAVGDRNVPGIGDKPMSQIKDDEKTTPAGRFPAQPGRNASGEDIIWIDYDAAISMHRMRKVAESEHRAERMASPDVSDNRISYGCVNVPPAFYNSVLKPTVMKNGAIVYVLPETMTPQQQFGSFDVPAKDKAVQLAQASTVAKAGK